MTLSHGQMEPLQVGSAASEVRRHTPRDWIRSFDLIRSSAIMPAGLIGLSATTIGRFLPSDCEGRSAVCFRLAVLHLSLIIMMLVARWVASRNGFGFEQIKASTVLQLDALSYGSLAAIVLVHPSLRRLFSLAASPPPA